MALIEAGSFGDLSLVADPHTKAPPEAQAIDTFSTLGQAAQNTPAEKFQFAQSAEPRGLTLKKLYLDAGFQGFMTRLLNKTSDIYFLAWGWDMSGEAIQGTSPVFFYPGAVSGPDSTLIPLRGDEAREFLGAGVLLYPQRKITAGLALRLQIWESKKGTRDLGKTLETVATQIQGSSLNQVLTLLSAATGVTGATLALVEGASLELAKVIGTVLQANSDDYVDYYEGYFPSSEAWAPPDQSWNGQSSEIVLSRI